MVRITLNMTNDRTLFNLQNNINRLATLQDQLSTGRRISRPSDDPIDFPASLNLRSTVHQTRSFQRNISTAESNLQHTESALDSTTRLLQDIRTLAVQGATDFDYPARLAIAEQIRVLQDQLVELSNTNVKGQFIFGGGNSRQTSFVNHDGTVLYQGDDFERNVAIGKGSQVASNIAGSQTFLHTPNQVTGAVRLADTSAPLSEQLRLANPNFPNLPPLPDGPASASVDRSPNPTNNPGPAPNNLARFYIHGQEIRADISVDSLEDIRDRINATIDDAVASINDQNQLVLTSRRADGLSISNGETPIGFEPDAPYGLNLMGALGLYQRIEEGRSIAQGYPATIPLTDPNAVPTPTRAPVRVQEDSFLFAVTNTGPSSEPAVPFGDNLALTNLDENGDEAFVSVDTPEFIDELEALRITIDDEVIDLDLRALTQGRDFGGAPNDADDVPGSTLGDLLELINNHPELAGKATAYINSDGTGIGFTPTSDADVFQVENVRKLFGRDITTRVTVDPLSNETTVTRTSPFTRETSLDDLPGALVDPATGSLGIRRPDPLPGGLPPTTNEGFIVIQNNGRTESVDLREAETIGDVIDTINDANVSVRASINSTGTGIVVESTVGSNDTLSIIDMNDGTIARDLGLFSPPQVTRLQSNPGFVDTDLVGAIAPDALAGTFQVEIRDGMGATLETYSIEVNPFDSLGDIAQRIDEADGKAGPGGGLLSANVVGGQLNIISNYDGHTILVDPDLDTTNTDPTRQFTRVLGIAGYTTVSEASVDPPAAYVSEQNTASVLGLDAESRIDEVKEQNVFRSVSLLERALRGDDTEGIEQALDNLDVDLDQILTSRTEVGARINRLDSAGARLQLNEDFLREELSLKEDADLSETITEFTLTQNAFNAALQATSRILQQSLLDFLR